MRYFCYQLPLLVAALVLTILRLRSVKYLTPLVIADGESKGNQLLSYILCHFHQSPSIELLSFAHTTHFHAPHCSRFSVTREFAPPVQAAIIKRKVVFKLRCRCFWCYSPPSYGCDSIFFVASLQMAASAYSCIVAAQKAATL